MHASPTLSPDAPITLIETAEKSRGELYPGDELWIGTFAGDRIAYRTLPKAD